MRLSIGYDVNQEGNIIIPVIGTIKVEGKTLEEARKISSYVEKYLKTLQLNANY